MRTAFYFEDSDFQAEGLPLPGYYASRISAARFRVSGRGNLMLQVEYTLSHAPAAYDRASDYFVLEGGVRGVALARAKLLRLYRACGLQPKGGEEIAPEDLVGASVEVKIIHDEYEGRTRLRVVNYRPCVGASASEKPPMQTASTLTG